MKGYWLILGTEIPIKWRKMSITGCGHRSRRNTKRACVLPSTTAEPLWDVTMLDAATGLCHSTRQGHARFRR
jgi:hypothetical protein